MRKISASVGEGASNHEPDVRVVQELLNRVSVGEGGPATPLKVDGLAWSKTIGAIRRFQSVSLGHKWPDGRVDPAGKTLARLNEYDAKPAPAKHLIYKVPGAKTVIGQPSLLACWATVYAMMRSWREGKKFGIAEALEKPGKQYVDMFNKNHALPPGRFRDFWTRGGLTVRGNAPVFPDYIWHDLLLKHGLLAVGSTNTMPPATGLHLRILEGMSVHGEPSDHYFMIDPAFGGQQYAERAFDFESKYNLAMTIGGGAHWQIAHYY